MRALLILFLSLVFAAAVHAADTAGAGKIIKVLPFLIDQKGRNATSPSLFDRDAYQAYLRDHPTNIASLRFDILWKAAKAPNENLKLMLELRGFSSNNVPGIKVLETNVVAGVFSKWTALPLMPPDYRQFGNAAAWRATLWDGGRLLSEEKSFLW